MSEADRSGEYHRLLAENRRYREAFDRSALTAKPLSGLVIVACMDARLDLEETLGLRTGDAHVIRNAGGLVTDDVIRSLVISTQLVGTREIVLIEHTGRALHGLDEDEIRERIQANGGPELEAIGIGFGAFGDLRENLRAQVAILREHPLLPRVSVHGLLFDVANGRLDEVA